MRILYITQYFYPEVGATTNRALANVKYLSEKGHDVTVLTEMPNHPKGIIFNGYKGKIFMTETMESFKIKRVWVYTSKKKTFVTRLLFYFSFMFMGILSSVVNWRKYDVVYVTSPPLFVGPIGIVLKKLFHKTKFIFEVRDLWPDSAIEIGELNSKKAIKLSYALENSLYKTADHIVGVTKSIRDDIIAKGFKENKVSLIYNGTDLEIKEEKIDLSLLKRYNLENKFTVIYAGNIGLAQNIKTVIDAVNLLNNDDISLLIVGTGPEEKMLQNYVKENRIRNISFTGEVKRCDVGKYLALADCSIVPLRNVRVFEKALPSKLFDYMSVNLPVIAGLKGEAKELLESTETGICYEPEDVSDLSEKIKFLYDNPDILEKLSKNGYNIIKEKFNRETSAAKLEALLLKLLNL